jgi:hypothetical protein
MGRIENFIASGGSISGKMKRRGLRVFSGGPREQQNFRSS